MICAKTLLSFLETWKIWQAIVSAIPSKLGKWRPGAGTGAECSSCPVHWPLQADVHIFESWKVLHEYIASVKACTSEIWFVHKSGSTSKWCLKLPGWRSMHFPLQACYLVRSSMGVMMSRSILSSGQRCNFFKIKYGWVLYPAALMALSSAPRNCRDSAETCSRCRWIRFLSFSATGCLSGLDGDWRQVCSILEQGRGSLKAVTIESTLYFDVFCAGPFCLSQQLAHVFLPCRSKKASRKISEPFLQDDGTRC